MLVLHGAGVDHRETEACFEPALEGISGLRRVYPDLPGMGRTPAPASLRGADDVVDTLLDLADEVSGEQAYLLVGHSAGAYLALGMATRRPERVAGLALVCPLLPGVRDVPERRPVVAAGDLGDASAPPCPGPTAVVAGRRDSTVGHALPHEKPDLLRALLTDWVQRVERAG